MTIRGCESNFLKKSERIVNKTKNRKKLSKMGLSKKVIISELYQLVHPYYWINLILCLSFLGLKLISPFCEILFGPGAESCELDMRENEILFFLLIIVMVKSRKSGATHSAAAYLASGFIYAKVSLPICRLKMEQIRVAN